MVRRLPGGWLALKGGSGTLGLVLLALFTFSAQPGLDIPCGKFPRFVHLGHWQSCGVLDFHAFTLTRKGFRGVVRGQLPALGQDGRDRGLAGDSRGQCDRIAGLAGSRCRLGILSRWQKLPTLAFVRAHDSPGGGTTSRSRQRDRCGAFRAGSSGRGRADRSTGLSRDLENHPEHTGSLWALAFRPVFDRAGDFGQRLRSCTAGTGGGHIPTALLHPADLIDGSPCSEVCRGCVGQSCSRACAWRSHGALRSGLLNFLVPLNQWYLLICGLVESNFRVLHFSPGRLLRRLHHDFGTCSLSKVLA